MPSNKIRERNLVIGYFTIFSIMLLILFVIASYIFFTTPTQNDQSFNAIGSGIVESILFVYKAFFTCFLILIVVSLTGYYKAKAKRLKERQKAFVITTFICTGIFVLLLFLIF